MDEVVGAMQRLKLVLDFDSGPFFKKIETDSDNVLDQYEENHESLNFNYYKATEFMINPDPEFVKNANDPAQNIKYGQISIDGEAFPPDKYSGKVIPRVLRIFKP